METKIVNSKYSSKADFRRVASGPGDNSDESLLFTLQDYSNAIRFAHAQEDYNAITKIMIALMDQTAQKLELFPPSLALSQAFKDLDKATDYRLEDWGVSGPKFAQALFIGMLQANCTDYSTDGADLVRKYIKNSTKPV